jgi:hypothetical protein
MTGLEVAALALTAASAVTGAVGAIQQGNAQAASLRAQADQANYNRQVSLRNRDIALQQSDADQASRQLEHRRQLATIRAGYGNSGLDISGSALDVIEDTALEQQLDVAKIGYSGKLKALELTDKATLFEAESKNLREASKSALTGGYIGAAGAVLKSASSYLTPSTTSAPRRG